MLAPNFKIKTANETVFNSTFHDQRGRGGGGGCDGCALVPPTGSRSPLFIDQRLKESKVILEYCSILIH